MLDNSIVLELITVFDKKKLCDVSNTLNYVLEDNPRNYDWKKICIGIINSFITMHGMKILHNDINENNILIDRVEGGIPKIFDFGKATHYDRPIIYNHHRNRKRFIIRNTDILHTNLEI